MHEQLPPTFLGKSLINWFSATVFWVWAAYDGASHRPFAAGIDILISGLSIFPLACNPTFWQTPRVQGLYTLALLLSCVLVFVTG